MSSVIRRFSEKGLTIASFNDLSTVARTSIEEMIKFPTDYVEEKLGGRGAVRFGELPGFGDVVIKQYARGGVLRRLVKSSHLKIGKIVRSQWEFLTLHRVRQLGVRAPLPIAFVYTDGLFYKAWLVMEKIPEAHSLAFLANSNERAVRYSASEVIRQIEILVRNQIFHLDLHPGNVLVDNQGMVWFIDFDKAKRVEISKQQLKELYLRRWRRAVIKHELPDYLSELICGGLRRLEEDEQL
jgi:3-deoxy-D-manno-octulosonic acid kinase